MGLSSLYKITSLHGNIKQITDNYSIIKDLNIPIYTNLPLHTSTILSLHLKSTNEETATKSNNPSTTTSNIDNTTSNNNNSNNINNPTINNSVNKKTILVIPPIVNRIICKHPSTGMLCRQKDITICSIEFLEIINKVIASKVIENYLEQVDMHPNMAIKFGRK